MNNTLRIKILITLLFMLSTDFFVAQNYPHIFNFSKNEYHAANKNWDIDQDSRGILYVANDLGMLVFDGVEWKLYSLPNHSVVRSVKIDTKGRIHTGGYEEFGYWERQQPALLTYHSIANQIQDRSIANNDFWKIVCLDDQIYYQSFESIYTYRPSANSLKRLSTNQSFLFLNQVNNRLWIQEMQGSLCQIKNDNLHKINDNNLFLGADLRVILPFDQNRILLGTATKGIYIYDGTSFNEWNPSLSQIMLSKDLNCGIKSSRNTFILGTILDGIYEVDLEGNLLNHFSTINGLQNNTVLSLFEDNSGNIWAGLDKGIDFIKYWHNIDCYLDYRGTIGAVYDATFYNEHLFIGTNQGVYFAKSTDLNKPDLFSNLKLLEGTQGQVWKLNVIGDKLFCCHNRGLKEIGKDFSVQTYKNLHSGVYDIQETELNGQKIKLLSTYLSLKIMDESGFIFNFPEISDPVIHTEVDHLGNIWLEHPNKGVTKCKLKPDLSGFEKTHTYGGKGSHELPFNLTLFKVGGRIMLIGNNSFYTYDDVNDKIVESETLNACFNNRANIKKAVYIGANLYWGISSHSLFKFSFDGYDAHILEEHPIEKSNLYLVNGYENLSILNDSLNFICLDNGFLLYNNSKKTGTTLKKTIQKPSIEYFETKNQKKESLCFDLGKKIKIPLNYNTVRIGILEVSSFTNDLQFQYILEGVDMKWSDPALINQVIYERLPKGKYEFKVRTIDNYGNYSEISSCPFEISPPWFVSPVALLFYLIALTIVSAGIWNLILKRYRNKHLLKIRQRQTQRLQQLNKELEEQVEAKNAELLSQKSFIIHRNELILKIKNEVDTFSEKNPTKAIAPLYQRINLLLNKSMDAEEDWKMFLIKFEEKHKNFFQQLKKEFPQLTPADLRLCACLRLNLESKDIASLMNLSVRAVENNRYRLRKKLNLQPSQNLNDFILKIQ